MIVTLDIIVNYLLKIFQGFKSYAALN
ncbi:DUF764 family protein, partial [Borreliella garinii]